MKKETVTAVVFGIILGGILAVILIVKNRDSQLAKNKAIAPTEKTVQPALAVNADVKPMEIVSPDDRTIVDKNSVTIKVNAIKNSLVIIQSPAKDMVFMADKDQFSVDFPLAYGENVIRVAIYPKDKQLRPQEKELRVYYLDQNL